MFSAIKKNFNPDSKIYPVLIVEILSIFLSVLLAFTINSWRENRQNRIVAESATERIILELEANAKSIEGIQRGRRAMIDTIKVLMKSKDLEKMNPADVIINSVMRDGFRVANLTKSAWTAAQVSGAIQYMEFHDVTGFAQLYEWQESGIKNNYKEFSEFLLDVERFKKADLKNNLMVLVLRLQVIQSMEDALLKAINEQMEMLKSEQGKNETGED